MQPRGLGVHQMCVMLVKLPAPVKAIALTPPMIFPDVLAVCRRCCQWAGCRTFQVQLAHQHGFHQCMLNAAAHNAWYRAWLYAGCAASGSLPHPPQWLYQAAHYSFSYFYAGLSTLYQYTVYLDDAWCCACCTQEVLPVGPFRTFQVQLSEVEDLTGLMWDDVVRSSEVPVEQFSPRGEAAAAAGPLRRELRSFADIVV
jgi:hypothetical protein